MLTKIFQNKLSMKNGALLLLHFEYPIQEFIYIHSRHLNVALSKLIESRKTLARLISIVPKEFNGRKLHII